MRALILALALAACAAQTTTPAAENDMPAALALDGTHWRLAGADDEARRPTMSFSTAEGELRAAGFAGCNRWFGTVTQTDDGLSFGAVGATRMMCPEQQMATERSFLAALGQTLLAQMDGAQLILVGAEAAEVARFDAMAAPSE